MISTDDRGDDREDPEDEPALAIPSRPIARLASGDAGATRASL